MSTVGVKKLKNRLTQYLRWTKQGEEVIVTERGTPIAVRIDLKNHRGRSSVIYLDTSALINSLIRVTDTNAASAPS